MKVILIAVCVLVLLSGCSGGMSNLFSSGALESCGECVSDLMEERAEKDQQTAVDRLLNGYDLPSITPHE